MTNTVNKIKLIDNYILFIYGYIFIMPWNFFKGQMGLFTVLLFIWWLFKFRNKIFKMLKSILIFKPLLILILFILYKYIAVLWSDDIVAAIEYTNKYNKYYFLIIPVLFTSLSINEAKNGLKVFIFSFGMYAIFSFLIYLNLFTILETGSNHNNPKGILGYAIMSQYMAIGTISAFFIALYSKNKIIRFVFFTIVILCFIGLFINNSRTAQLSFVFTFLTILIANYRIYILNKKILGSVLIVSLLTIYFLNTSGKIKRYQSAYSEVEKIITDNKYTGSFGLRIYFTKAGIEIIKDNFWFGTGPLDSIDLFRSIQKNDPNYKNRIFSAFHNIHIDILTQYGIVGYILLVFSITYLLYKVRKSRTEYIIGLSFFITTFFISFANGTFTKKPINYILITVFILLSVIAYKKYQEHNNKITDDTVR